MTTDCSPIRDDADGLNIGTRDAVPGNTASHSCKPVERILRYGIDSLYLSFPGKLSATVEERLLKLKQKAQSEHPSERSRAQYQIDSHIFEVKDQGRRTSAFILVDGAYRIELRRRSTKLPMAYVSIDSRHLSTVTPQDAVTELVPLLGQLGQIDSEPRVGRVDVFLDFASLYPMEWRRRNWVTRAKRFQQHAENGRFTGWGIGYGGPLTARLYDKDFEIDRSNKQYLRTLWDQMGWNGKDPVWRLEFQYKSEVLRRLGLRYFSDVREQLNGLWCYAMDDWLRLSIPNEGDSTRSRWPIDPLWAELSSIDFDGPAMPRLHRIKQDRIPNESRALDRTLSGLMTFMAIRGIDDFQAAWKELGIAAWGRLGSKSFFEGASAQELLDERIAERRREFNITLNPLLPSRLDHDAEKEYRNASGG